MTTDLGRVVDAFAKKRVLVVGDVMLDEYVSGRVRRVSPEAPVPVVEVHAREYRAGGAGNTAANIASLGGIPMLGAVCGDDTGAIRLRQALDEALIGHDGVLVDASRSTTTKTRVMAQGQQVTRLDLESRAPIAADTEERLLSWAISQIDDADACVLSDYAKGTLSESFSERFITAACASGKPIVADPKGFDFRKYAGATIVTPNTHEAGIATGLEIEYEADLQEAAERLLSMLGSAAILITRGGEGMSLFQKGSRRTDIAATARNVFDVTGAGDTVVGTISLSLAAGANLWEAAWLANIAAGIVVAKSGTSTATPSELLKELQGIEENVLDVGSSERITAER